MCGLCGSFSELHWSAGPLAASRSPLGRRQIAEAAGRLLGRSGARVADWGQGFRVTGPTGRTELALDLATLWRAAGRVSREVPDPLDLGWIKILERETRSGRR